jgi:hypothetical protein
MLSLASSDHVAVFCSYLCQSETGKDNVPKEITEFIICAFFTSGSAVGIATAEGS